MKPFRQLLIGLLVLAFGHVPIPYWHDHANLAGADFQQHATWYHTQQTTTHARLGWHFHLMPMDAGSGLPAGVVRLARAPASLSVEPEFQFGDTDSNTDSVLPGQFVMEPETPKWTFFKVQRGDHFQPTIFQRSCVLRL